MKQLLKDLAPPLLVKMLSRSLSPPRIFKTYQAALNACQGGAYENNDLVKVVVDKNLAYRTTLQAGAVFDLETLRTLIAIGLAKSQDVLRVIDFGGGGGYHHTIARKALGPAAALRWNVVETTAMAQEARRMAGDGLKFFDSTADAVRDLGSVDIVFTSSALQYCPDPMAFLKQLVDADPACICITRTPFSDAADDIITVQTSRLSANGPGPLPAGYIDRALQYPITYTSRQAIERLLSDRYEIRFKTQEGAGVFRLPGASISMTGYFCIRRP